MNTRKLIVDIYIYIVNTRIIWYRITEICKLYEMLFLNIKKIINIFKNIIYLCKYNFEVNFLFLFQKVCVFMHKFIVLFYGVFIGKNIAKKCIFTSKI